MRPATEAEILAETERAFGRPVDIKRHLDAGEAYALSCDAGVALFVLSAPSTYKITLCFNDGNGAQKKAAILNAFEWMFLNTDAETLTGYIAADNAACLAMVPQTRGYSLEAVPGGGKRYVVTKSCWEGARS